MVAVAKWLTQTAVTRLFVGSIPTSHPMKKIFKIVGIVIAVVAILLAGAYFFLDYWFSNAWH